MALLKSLIQRLLDNRTTPAEAANASIPAYSKNTQMAQATGTDKTFSAVAPYDCFVVANVNGLQQSSYGDCSIGLLINDVAVNLSNMKFLPGNVWFDRGAFAKKGDVIKLLFDPWSVNVVDTQFTLTFHKLIGGGYLRSFVSAVCKRGQLCLSRLSLYLPRSSFRTNPNGLAVKHTHQSGLLFHSALQNTFLQRMGIWDFTNLKETQTTPLMCMRLGQMETLFHEKLLHSQLQQVTLPSRVSYLLRKATGWLLAAPSMSYGSHQQWGVNTNLRTGGELC